MPLEVTMKQPNILFILSDDQGAWAMHCAGNSDIITPNLDRLAAQGARFDNFFCVSPVCSPARASILTGTIPSVHGVMDWLAGGNLDASLPEIQGKPVFQNETQPIRYLDHLTAYTDLMAQAGYTCALSGKWHLGDSLTPQHGFSRWYTIARGGCSYVQPEMVKDGHVTFENRYITDLIGEDARRNLRDLSQQEAPFYLSVHFTAPHDPWAQEQHPQEIWDLYEDCDFKATPDLPIHPWQAAHWLAATGEKRKRQLRGYYTAITAMDRQIGLLLDELDALGIADNTLVIFTGDNGMNLGQHGVWGKGNGTFPLNMYDSSVKVPCLMAWPRHIAPGTVFRELYSHYDLFPTFIDLLGLSGQVRQALPGQSFAHLFQGQAEKSTDAVIIMDEYGPVRMIRDQDWKLVMRYPYGPNELYHIKEDIDEEHNLYDDPAYREKRTQLRCRLESWFLKYVDPAMDSTREAVTGNGQLARAGAQSTAADKFL